MIGDCLVPVFTRIGAATIITCNNIDVLCESMQFHKIKCHLDVTKTEQKQFGLQLGTKKRLFVDNEARFLTQQGWRSAQEIHDFIETRDKNQWGTDFIKCLERKCILCSRYYFSVTPVVSTCGLKCYRKALEQGIIAHRLLNEKTIKTETREGWFPVPFVAIINVPAGLEVLHIDEIEGAKALYVFSVLFSTSNLMM